MLVLATGGTARTLLIGVPFWLVTIFLGFLLWPVFKYFPTVELVGLVVLVPLTFAFLWERRPRFAAVTAAAVIGIGVHGYGQFHAAKSTDDLEARMDFMGEWNAAVSRDAKLGGQVEPESWTPSQMQRALGSMSQMLGQGAEVGYTVSDRRFIDGKAYFADKCEEAFEWSYIAHVPGTAHRKYHFGIDEMPKQPAEVKATVLLERNRRGASAAWATCFDQVAW